MFSELFGEVWGKRKKVVNGQHLRLIEMRGVGLHEYFTSCVAVLSPPTTSCAESPGIVSGGIDSSLQIIVHCIYIKVVS